MSDVARETIAPRMQVEFELKRPPIEPHIVQKLSVLCEVIFGEPIDGIAWRLSSMPDVSVICAYQAGELVGFKLGYAMTQTRYYSWLGGVSPSARRSGVGTKLMELQHGWLIERGYSTIETSTKQENVSMAQLNLKSGFHVCGLRTEPHRTQVLYMKQLRQ